METSQLDNEKVQKAATVNVLDVDSFCLLCMLYFDLLWSKSVDQALHLVCCLLGLISHTEESKSCLRPHPVKDLRADILTNLNIPGK